MPENNIRFAEVTFGYEENQPLFTNLSFTLPLDKFVLLTGENGIGKSTLASLLSGMLKSGKGNISFRDKSICEWDTAILYSQMAFLQQKSESNIIAVSPREDLALWLLPLTRKIDMHNERILQALNIWNLSEKIDQPIWELSAGEMKRLSLAGMSLFPERFWIVDEPTTGLDKQSTEILLQTLRKKKQSGAGAFIISHNAEQFQNLIDEVWTLYPKGRIERA